MAPINHRLHEEIYPNTQTKPTLALLKIIMPEDPLMALDGRRKL